MDTEDGIWWKLSHWSLYQWTLIWHNTACPIYVGNPCRRLHKGEKYQHWIFNTHIRSAISLHCIVCMINLLGIIHIMAYLKHILCLSILLLVICQDCSGQRGEGGGGRSATKSPRSSEETTGMSTLSTGQTPGPGSRKFIIDKQNKQSWLNLHLISELLTLGPNGIDNNIPCMIPGYHCRTGDLSTCMIHRKGCLYCTSRTKFERGLWSRNRRGVGRGVFVDVVDIVNPAVDWSCTAATYIIWSCLILVRMTTGCAHKCHVSLTSVWLLTLI